MLSLLQVSLCFEILAFLASVFFYLRKKNTLILYFIPFLLLTVSVEILGKVWPFPRGFWFNKFILYNIFTTVEFIFYAFVFFKYFKKHLFKKFALLFIPIFIVLVVLNFLFVQGLDKTFHTYTFLVGSFFVVVSCCCFFYESVQPEQIDQQLSKMPFFWICSGLLIFYLGSVIINALYQYLTSNDMRVQGQRVYDIINGSLNVVLYSSFCIAFYLCPKNKKTYSSQ